MKRASLAVERWACAGVAAAAIGLTPAAHALGLGKLAVQSAIGESLRAEIDITSLTPEEAANLKVQVATPEAYRAAGVDYNAVLPGTRATVLRRADGRPYLRLTSDRSVLEPFIDVILEVSWNSGRLVREYTMLFDPPSSSPTEAQAAASASPVLPAAEAPRSTVATAPAPAPSPAPSLAASVAAPEPAPIATRPAARPRGTPLGATTVPPAAPPAAERAAANTAQSDQYTVKQGDSLSRIAARTQRPGVSLDQMLVSLYQGNPGAFVGSNMNRLKSGVVLDVPSAEVARAVPPAEARQTIQAQSADFGAYRQRLASGALPAHADAPSRVASGAVQAKVQDNPRAAAVAPDKLTLSKNAAAAAKAAAAEEAISKQREQQASAQRLAELRKNLSDLTKLSGVASAAHSASAQPQVAAAPVAASAASLAVVVPARVAVPVPAPEPAPVVATASAPEASPRPAAATIAAAPASTASRPTVPPPTTTEAPGFFASLMDDQPWLLGIGAVAVALLAGLALLIKRRRDAPASDVGETSFLESRLLPDSFFGASGGQRVDTHEASGGAPSSMSYSLSQLDAIGDVDPVAEADVYLAYGRDLQAEEILKEAMRSNPERLAIRTKLLEVYAKRRDIRGFEALATQLFKLTGGVGEDWSKAQELGAHIDPDNVLYQPGGTPPVPALGDAERAIELLGASTMPQSVLPSPSQFGLDAAQREHVVTAGNAGIDLDLDFDPGTAGAPAPAAAPFAQSGHASADDFLDFLGAPDSRTAAPSPMAEPIHEPSSAFAPTEVQPSDPPPLRAAPVPRPPAAAPASAPIDAPLEFDLSSISLDFDPEPRPALPATGVEARELDMTPTAAGELFDEDDGADPLERKLDLAEEFRQIGDLDGARELLHEVVSKGSGGVKERAERLLMDLA